MIAALLFVAASAAPMPPTLKAPLPATGSAANEGAGAFIYSLFVDPQGSPFDCRIEMATVPEAARDFCDRLMRARFEPARDRAGKARYGLLRELVVGKQAAAGDPPAIAPDLTLTVKPLPSLGGKARDLTVAAEIDKEGKIADCAAAAGETAGALVSAACAQLKAQWSGVTLEDPQNSPRHYVRTLKVSIVPEGLAAR